jgi:hypothetical protein
LVKVISKLFFLLFIALTASHSIAMTEDEYTLEMNKYAQRHMDLTNFLNTAISGQLNQETIKSPIVLIKTCEIYLNLVYAQRFSDLNGHDVYSERAEFKEQIDLYTKAIGFLGANGKYCADVIGTRALNTIINNS